MDEWSLHRYLATKLASTIVVLVATVQVVYGQSVNFLASRLGGLERTYTSNKDRGTYTSNKDRGKQSKQKWWRPWQTGACPRSGSNASSIQVTKIDCLLCDCRSLDAVGNWNETLPTSRIIGAMNASRWLFCSLLMMITFHNWITWVFTSTNKHIGYDTSWQ